MDAPKYDVLQVHYDTRLGPVTFDFSNFLACAEAHRQKIEAESIHLHIISPDFRRGTERELQTSKEQQRWRLNHILMRLVNLVPTIRQFSLHWQLPKTLKTPNFPEWYPPADGRVRMHMPYGVRHVNDMYAQGFDVQPYRSSEWAREMVGRVVGTEPYYTISLRTTQFASARNSRLGEWYATYKELVRRGHRVFVIPDFEDLVSNRESSQYDWRLLDFATYEPDLRLALYERAVDNLCVNGGISTIMAYSQSPMKMFKIVTPGIAVTSEEHILKSCRVGAGESPPYFRPNQKWIWEEDTADNILRHL